MKKKIKNDGVLSEKMTWNMILSLTSLVAIFKLHDIILKPSSGIIDRDIVAAVGTGIFIILAIIFFARYVMYMLVRKANRKRIDDLMNTGIKTTARVEEIIQKGISVKYALRVTYKDPYTSENIYLTSPFMHDDPRRFINSGSEISVYIDANNRDIFHMDIPS